MEELFILVLILATIALFVMGVRSLFIAPTPHARWTWGAFLWGPIYYLVHGLHAKGLALLVAGILLGFFTGGLLAIPFWIYCALDAGKAFGRRHDDEMELKRKKHQEQWKLKQQRAQEEERSHQALEQRRRLQEEQRRAEHQRRANASRVSGAKLAQKFAQISLLVQTGMMTPEEAATEQRQLIAQSARGWTDEDMPTFLTPFAELAQRSQINQTDLKLIKGLYNALSKGFPTMP
jgi:hypothetical protein